VSAEGGFFFEKKKQKTFATLAETRRLDHHQKRSFGWSFSA